MVRPLTWLTLAGAVGTGVALPPRAVAPSLDAALDAMEELTRALAGTLSAERLPLETDDLVELIKRGLGVQEGLIASIVSSGLTLASKVLDLNARARPLIDGFFDSIKATIASKIDGLLSQGASRRAPPGVAPTLFPAHPVRSRHPRLAPSQAAASARFSRTRGLARS